MSALMKISPQEIKVLAPFIQEVTGIVLDERKAYLFETRLRPVLKAHDLHDYLSLIPLCRRDSRVCEELINAITTQETLFFRDKSPFNFIQNKFFPEFFERQGMNSRVRIWSAASSTGQEAYSILMTLSDILFDLSRYNVRILATDISDDAIARASAGVYSKFELARGLDTRHLHKYFSQSGERWKVKDELRSFVHFRKMNLLKAFVGVEKQDLVFCRNVAIYFSKEDRASLYNRIADVLNPEGVLIISSTESLFGLTDRFVKEDFRGAAYYRKVK